MAHLEARRIIELRGLPCNGLDDFLSPMARVYTPQPGHAIKNLSAVYIRVKHAFGASQQAGILLELSVGSEWHPQVGKVGLGDRQATVRDKVVTIAVFLGLGQAFVFLPDTGRQGWEVHVAVYFGVYFGGDDFMCYWKRFGKDLGSAYYAHRFGIAAGGQGVSQRRKDLCALRRVVGVATDYQVGSPGQRSPQRFPGLATHDDGLAHGRALEMRQIFGKAPGKIIVAANHAVAGVGDDQLYVGLCHSECAPQTATGALMCGWN